MHGALFLSFTYHGYLTSQQSVDMHVPNTLMLEETASFDKLMQWTTCQQDTRRIKERQDFDIIMLSWLVNVLSGLLDDNGKQLELCVEWQRP